MSANSYYEAHITMLGNPQVIKPIVENIKWRFSAIDGDPNLGPGIKCYATKHFKASRTRTRILEDLQTTAATLQLAGCAVIRRKVELVIFDDRSSTVRFHCEGDCPECQDDWKNCNGCRGQYKGKSCPYCDGTFPSNFVPVKKGQQI